MRFKDQVVVVTGGNSGIGRATVLHFAREGARIAIADLADAVPADLVEALGTAPFYRRVDVAKRDAVMAFFAEVLAEMGQIDVLVNSAGVGGVRARADVYPEDTFDFVMDVNVKGTMFCMQAALQHFFERQRGAVVNIASMAGQIVMNGHLAYATSKHAVIGLTKAAAVDFARYGIRINAVCPAFTHTPMFDSIEGLDKLRESLRQATPMKRFAEPDEIARVILFLASDEASYMTGTSVNVDGGMILQ
jgi:3-oxoacyl-[acyl-carrier protein] reductase